MHREMQRWLNAALATQVRALGLFSHDQLLVEELEGADFIPEELWDFAAIRANAGRGPKHSQHWSRNVNWDADVLSSLPPAFVERRQPLLVTELRWWRDELHLWNGNWIRPSDRPSPRYAYQSDASGYGAGLRLRRLHPPRLPAAAHPRPSPSATTAAAHEDVQFYWRGVERHQSINFKELSTPDMALRVLDKKAPLRGGVIFGELDNSAAVSMLNKQGGRTPKLSLIAERFWRWCLRRGLFHVAQHLPGVLDVDADRISRERGDRSEWRLSAAAWAEVEQAFGPHTVDLFAARHNTLLPRYFSRFLDLESAAEDALQQDWAAEGNPYAHPPFVLLPQVLRKVREQQVPAISIVAPIWPAQHWLPDLMSMSVAPPTILTSDPLLTPHLSSHKPPSRPRWSTAVWRISGLDSSPKVALQRQWNSIWRRGPTRDATS